MHIQCVPGGKVVVLGVIVLIILSKKVYVAYSEQFPR